MIHSFKRILAYLFTPYFLHFLVTSGLSTSYKLRSFYLLPIPSLYLIFSSRQMLCICLHFVHIFFSYLEDYLESLQSYLDRDNISHLESRPKEFRASRIVGAAC